MKSKGLISVQSSGKKNLNIFYLNSYFYEGNKKKTELNLYKATVG